MEITGKQLIAGNWVQGNGGHYRATNPASARQMEPEMSFADHTQVVEAVAAASACAKEFANSSQQQRAEFLNTCAEEIIALGDVLVERVMAETGYPRVRAEGERARTCGQLKLFASSIVSGEYLDIRIDTALPDRQPLPRPDLRYMNQALGPVAVFGASNFPLAFSVAGGDTASALAAGCPVIVKGHNSHPGTSELVAAAVDRAAKQCGLPDGVFSLLMGPGKEIGAELVTSPGIRAVGFTGSTAGGTALFKLANARPEPIPVFAEMGSINPVILLPEALKQSAAAIAENFIASLNMGVGQFCVNPGLVLAVDDESLEQFVEATSQALANVEAGVMLNGDIQGAYCRGTDKLKEQSGVSLAGSGQPVASAEGYRAQAGLFVVDAETFNANPGLQEEVFGPASLVVKCRDREQLLSVVASLRGQLTGTIHCSEDELAGYQALVDLLRQRVGRLVINGFPTGVEVCDAMMHGGPFPAATDSRFTSVGTAAIARFVRPICFQNYPEPLLPAELRDSNPLGLARLVNGEKTQP